MKIKVKNVKKFGYFGYSEYSATKSGVKYKSAIFEDESGDLQAYHSKNKREYINNGNLEDWIKNAEKKMKEQRELLEFLTEIKKIRKK